MKTIFLVLLASFLIGCSSVHLKWGDVEYTAWGDTALRDVLVTRECDGCKITIQAATSDTSNAETIRQLSEALNTVIAK